MKPYHPLLQKVSDEAGKLLMPKCHLLRLQIDQVLYKQGDDSNDCAYLIIYGVIELTSLPRN